MHDKIFLCKNTELTSSQTTIAPSLRFLFPFIACATAVNTAFSVSAVQVNVTKSPSAAPAPVPPDLMRKDYGLWFVYNLFNRDYTFLANSNYSTITISLARITRYILSL